MSRTSINRRLDRLRDTLLPPGSLEWRVDRLSDGLKRAYQSWRERCEAIFLAAEKRQPGGLYETMLAGDSITPTMPFAVAKALDVDRYLAVVTADMSLPEIADRWQQMLDEDR